MLITKTSIFTGKVHQMDLPITQEQLDSYGTRDVLIQDAFPNLSPAQREFLMTGITPDEWNKVFGEDS